MAQGDVCLFPPQPFRYDIKLQDTCTGGGSTFYERSVSDSAIATDAVTRRVTGVRQLTDSAPNSDIVVRGVQAARGVGDTAQASDAASRAAQTARTVQDSAPVSESVDQSLQTSRSVNDSAVVSDGVSRSVQAGRSVSDTAQAVDSVIRVLVQARTLLDEAPATDAAIRVLLAQRTVLDSAPATDSVTSEAGMPARDIDLRAVLQELHPIALADPAVAAALHQLATLVGQPQIALGEQLQSPDEAAPVEVHASRLLSLPDWPIGALHVTADMADSAWNFRLVEPEQFGEMHLGWSLQNLEIDPGAE